MRTLLLFRHGKSDWSRPATGDHDRPLNSRGEKAAEVMGRFLQRAGQVPEMVKTSSAIRARNTLDLARKAGDWGCDIQTVEDLYDSNVSRVLEIMRGEAETTRSLMLVGHEPTWSQMVEVLCQGAAVRFPTAAMARVDLGIHSWREATFSSGKLIWFLPPKVFTKGDFEFVV